MDSGASIAPPERFRSSAVTMPVPVITTRSTRQRRSDVQVALMSASSTSKKAVDIPEEEGEEEGKGEEGEGEGEGKGKGKGGKEKEEKGKEEKGKGKEKEREERRDEDEDEKDHEDKKNNESEKDGKNGDSTMFVSTSQISSVVETFQHGRSTTPKPVIIADDDITMKSPPTSPLNLHGASRISGGVFRGQAVGNVLNAADFSNLNNNNYIGPVRGQVNIYLSQEDPARLSPDSLTAYARLPYDYASHTPIAPVLEKVARRYSPVRRK